MRDAARGYTAATLRGAAHLKPSSIQGGHCGSMVPNSWAAICQLRGAEACGSHVSGDHGGDHGHVASLVAKPGAAFLCAAAQGPREAVATAIAQPMCNSLALLQVPCRPTSARGAASWMGMAFMRLNSALALARSAFSTSSLPAPRECTHIEGRCAGEGVTAGVGEGRHGAGQRHLTCASLRSSLPGGPPQLSGSEHAT